VAERLLEDRLAEIVRAVRKASPGDAAISVARSGAADQLDALVDAIESLMSRTRASEAAFLRAEAAMAAMHASGLQKLEAGLPADLIRHMNALEDTIADNIYFKDLHSRFIHVSKAFVGRLNLTSPTQLIGKTDFDTYREDHAREAFEDEQRIMRTGEPIVNKEERETWLDRPDTWVLTTKMPLRDAHGTIVGTFGISRDITDYKLTEIALRKSEERYRLLFNSINDAILIREFHPEGGREAIVEVNTVACQCLEATPEELLQKSMRDVHAPGAMEGNPAAMRRLRSEGHVVYESVLLTARGRAIPAEISDRLFELDGKPMVFEIGRASCRERVSLEV
jgi:PAS domain S-box-containing protein